MVSVHYNNSRLTAVTGKPKRGKSQIPAFPTLEDVTLYAQQPTVLLLTTALPYTLKTHLWMFLIDYTLATWNSITASCLYHTSLTDSTVRHGCQNNLYNFIHKSWKLQICFIKSHIPSFVTGPKKISNMAFWATSQDNLVSTLTRVQTEQSR